MQKVTLVEVSRLKPADWNPRKIRENRFKNLCKSIETDPKFMENRPILESADGTIYAGNMRYRAAVELGWSTVPAIIEDIPEQLAKQRALRDNAQWGDWAEEALAGFVYDLQQDGADLELIGIEPGELQKLLLQAEGIRTGLTDPDEVPEVKDFVSTPGTLWALGDHRLLCGDSTNADDVDRLFGDEMAALLATDPPYLVDYDGANHPGAVGSGDNRWDSYEGDSETVKFYSGFLRLALEHLRANSAIYQWHASRRQVLVEQAWSDAGLHIHQTVIWAKARGIPSRSHLMWRHEPCFYGWLDGHSPRRKPPAHETTVWEIDHQPELQGINPT